MFWFILIVILTVVVLIKAGVFRRTVPCKQCNVALKGSAQVVLGYDSRRFVLCKDCFSKIHPKISKYAKDNWSYAEYSDYLAWDDATREERAQFRPTDEYGYIVKLKIDTERCLFTIGDGKNDIVLRFADIRDFDINFKPEKLKEGVFSTKVKGSEYVAVELITPALYIEEILHYGASYKLREKGFINKQYEYDFSEEFMDIIRAFTICIYIVENAMNEQMDMSEHDIDEIQKALALFMFDSMEEVTEDSLKRQRNTMIKAFHPDNNENNEAYSQKINTAYELLSGLISR